MTVTDLPDPFKALRPAYGMLLGEDDFSVLAGNPRGKQMLHNSWLHGAGVVHGLGVGEEPGGHRLWVAPGLAIDGVGRELRVDGAGECLDVDSWLADRAKKGRPVAAEIVTHLVAAYDACTFNEVPVLADPCDVERRHTGDSRVHEKVHLTLCEQPYDVHPAPRPGPYHGLRVLLGLEGCVAGRNDVGVAALKERRAVAGKPAAARGPALVEAFRRIAALDVTALQEGLFPVPLEVAEIVLATVTITPQENANARWTADVSSRRSLVATSTIQELLCAVAPALAAVADPGSGGPRIKRSTIDFDGDATIVFEVTRPLCEATFVREQVRVRSWDADDGWTDEDVRPGGLTQTSEKERHVVRVRLGRPPQHDLVRLLVRGTGAEPVTGTDGVPLAGCDDDPPGTDHDGRDAVHQFDRTTGAKA